MYLKCFSHTNFERDIQKSTFKDKLKEDPSVHIGAILRICEVLKSIFLY